MKKIDTTDITIDEIRANLKKRFGDCIRSLRKDNEYTEEFLAEKLGINPTTYQKYESGTTIPRIEKILYLAKFYNVTTDYILFGDNLSESAEITQLLENCPPEKKKFIVDMVTAMVSAINS